MTILVCNSCDKPINHNWDEKSFCQCQPERSKREDFAECPWVHLDHAHKDGCTDPETHGECKAKMRCSDLHRDM